MFKLTGLDTEVKSYISIFQRTQAPSVPKHLGDLVSPEFGSKIDTSLTNTILRAQKLPAFCNMPQNDSAQKDLHSWVINMLNDHCMVMLGTQAVPCKKYHSIDPLTPCMEEAVRNIAEEYGWHRGWCSVSKGLTDIPVFPDSAAQTNQLQSYSASLKNVKSYEGIRFMFMITAYTDAPQVMRLLKRLHSKSHRYVVVVDKSRSEFAEDLRTRVQSLGNNVVVVTPFSVVYLASSATRILAQGMAWILKEFKDWDYLISLTGSDYPLMGLMDIEKRLALRKPPMPSLMIWENNSVYYDAYKKFNGSDNDSILAQKALKILTEERLRQAFSRRRGNEQYGIPLTCENQKMFMRYGSRKITQVR